MGGRAAVLPVGLLFAQLLGGCEEAPRGPVLPEVAAEAPAPPPAAASAPSAPAPSGPAALAEQEEDAALRGPALHPDGVFFGEPDFDKRLALATQPVAEIELGRGGRSVGFKITLADGTKGYYKPEQTFSAAHWYAEVAVYYLDRELGIGRVPPTVGRRMVWEPLRKVAAKHPRLSEVVVQEDGTVRGAFIWWIPGDLVPIDPGVGWEKWIRQQGPLPISPYQAPYEWRRQLRQRRCARGDESACEEGSITQEERSPAGEPRVADRPAELSDMILFDFLTHNIDRWGTSFTNVRVRGRDGPLVYLDNGAGFFWEHRNGLMDARLTGVQKFRRETVDRIRKLDLARFHERMATDPLAPILDEHRSEGLAVRRRALLEHVDETVARFGEEAVFPW